MRPILPILPLLLLGGCLTDPVSPCESNAECRDAFGFGSVCAEDGYCETGALPDRCTPQPPDFATNPERYPDPIVVASMYDHDYDVAELQSARLAIAQANEYDGIDNRSIILLECSYQETLDDGLDNVTATDAIATSLTRDFGVNAYIGTLTSSSTQQLYNTTEPLGGAFILSPAASSPALTNIDGLTKTDADPGTLWRTTAPDSLQGRVAAQDMLSRDISRVAVVFQTGPYGEGLSQIFGQYFTAGGGHVDSYPFSDDAGLASAVATVKASDVQEVFVISSVTSDIANFLSAAHTIGGYDDIQIFLPDAAADVDTFNNTDADDLLDQIRGTRPSVPAGQLYDTFKAAYQATYQQDPEATVYMPLAYDAGWLMAYSVAWSLAQEGELTPKGMGGGMRHVSNGTPTDLLATNWNTVKASFKAATAVDVQGASGALDYSPIDEETTAPIDIWVYRDGQIQTIQTIYPDP
jgi:branched-chain amino acid transport system substrate-binding protein